MKSIRTLLPVLGACILLAAPAALRAQEPVKDLSGLVGVRAALGETELENRGYELVGGEKAGGSSYTYWREPKTRRCISVRTADANYTAIVYTPEADCKRVSQAATAAPPAVDANSFDTVCGVIVDGKTHRYRCQLRNEGCEGEGYCRSILTFPDNELKINWQKDDQIEVVFSGMNPITTKSSFSEGQTRFEFEGKTYFFYRNPERAKKEVANLKQ